MTRQITSQGAAGFACTVMAIREDTAGINEFAVRLCGSCAEAQHAAGELEAQVRDRVKARGGVIVESKAFAEA